MKGKKNIIKKISHSNPYTFLFRREIKRCFKKKQYKLKKYSIILKNIKYFKYTVKILNYFKFLQLKIKNLVLIKKNIYLNYITDGLNLKYDDLLVQIIERKKCVNNFQIINTVYSKNDLNTVKLHKFLTIFDKKYYIFAIESLNFNDYYLSTFIIFCSQILEIYKYLYVCIILKIN